MMNDMKTLQQEWLKYKESCYPEGITETQNRECHQAFFSGALTAMNLVVEASALPMNEAWKEIRRLADEATDACMSKVQANEARN